LLARPSARENVSVAERLGSDFRRFFIRGLAAFLPTLLTIWIIISIFTFVQKHLSRHINAGVLWLIAQVWRLASAPQTPKAVAEMSRKVARMRVLWGTYLWWVGFLVAIIGIYYFGKFAGSLIGRAVWRRIERAFFRLPVVRQIYPYIKQVTDFLLSEQKTKFTRVVAVEYPRKGLWSLGLVTGASMKTLKHALTDELLTVFIPSSPTPITGYTITVRRDEVIDLPMSVDDALRFTVSGGVIMPPHQRLSEKEIDEARYKLLPEGREKENSE